MKRCFPILLMAAEGLALAMIAGGCNHKELGDDNEPKVKVRVVYDWHEAPDANPAGMAAFFYNTETGESQRFDFKGLSGGVVELKPGNWHVTTYNNDTEALMLTGHEAFHTHTGFTREGSPLEGALGNSAPSTGVNATDERVVITPDRMWGHSREDVPLLVDPRTGEATVELRPHLLTCHYSYEIRNVSNLHHVAKMGATMSGLAGTLNFATEALGRESVTHPLVADAKDATTIYGECHTFGHHEQNPDPHFVTLYLWMDDGRKLAYGTTRANHWNVTDQVHNAPDRHRVHVVIDGLDIPVEVPVGSFTPGTDDWGTEDREIGI